MILIFVILVIKGVFLGMNYGEYKDYFEDLRFTKEKEIYKEKLEILKKEKIPKFIRLVVFYIIACFFFSALPTKNELFQILIASKIFTKENVEILDKLPTNTLKLLDKEIQLKLKELDKNVKK
jgi:hypothetical protein